MLDRYPHMFGEVNRGTEFLHYVNFRWERGARKLRQIKDPKWTRNVGFICLVHSLATGTLLLQFFHKLFLDPVKDPDGEVFAKHIELGLGVSLFFCFNVCLRGCEKHAGSLVAYVNGLLAVLRMAPAPGRRPGFLHSLIILFYHLAPLTVCILPYGVVYAVHWADNCKPSLVGYWLLEECRNDSPDPYRGGGVLRILENAVIRPLIFLFNHWAWAVGLSSALLVVLGIQIVCVLSLGECLDRCLGSRISIEEKTRIYRATQYLSLLGNEIGSGLFGLMNMIVVAPIATGSMALSTLIRTRWSSHSHNMVQLGTFCAVFANALFAIGICMTGMMSVYAKSTKQVIPMLRVGAGGGRERRWLRRFTISCPPIKVKFGLDNFVEENTVLNSFDFLTSLTVQFLLLS